MNVKKWIVLGVGSLIVAAASVWGGSSGFLSFGSAAYTIAVSQTSPGGIPQCSYESWWGSDIAALALGTQPTNNQVLALAMNCDSSQALLVIYDTSNSNITTIAQTTSLDTVQNADLTTGITNLERFVAMFDVLPVGNLAGGYLTVAGRLHLDTNGCATAILAAKDRNSMDTVMGDEDIVKFTPGNHKDITRRSGQAHFMGVLDVISSNGQTNTVLVPTGHLTFTGQLG
ncbi:MAG: hypothetical protein ABSD58_05935 [Verrucomicrobiia bacterium]